MTWQPDYQREFERRLKNRNKLMDNPELQASFNAHYENNPLDWINDWGITFDPRAKSPKPRLLPFLMFPRQVEFLDFILDCLDDKENGLTEKCRDMGATWECCAISVWLWRYQAGSIIGWGSRKAEYVDKMGDLKAIFPKIRMQINHMPPWMRPEGFNMKTHGTYMNIRNPVNMSAIIGEAGDGMGRGGRTSIYFKDESAHYENPEAIEAAMGDNTDVQIDISSVKGSANVFYRRRMAGEVWYKDKEPTPGKTRVFIFDWRDNPMKSQEWFDTRKKKAEEEGLLHIFKQEVCRDYAGSADRIVIPMEWIESVIDAHIKLGLPDGGEAVGAQDVADGGADKNALAIRTGIVLRVADDWAGESGPAARQAIPRAKEMKVTLFHWDSVGVGTGFKTEVNTMKEEKLIPAGMRILPWNGGGKVLDPDKRIIPNDKEAPKNIDQYENLKAQAYFRLRARFYKTHMAVTEGKKYDPADLISIDSTIPKLQELKMQLTQPVHKYSKSGKTMIDKQPNGAISPNLADAVNMCYCPIRPPVGFFS